MIEDVLNHTSPKTLGLTVVGILVLYTITKWIRVDLKIRSLGGRAPRVSTWLPFGITHSLSRQHRPNAS